MCRIVIDGESDVTKWVEDIDGDTPHSCKMTAIHMAVADAIIATDPEHFDEILPALIHFISDSWKIDCPFDEDIDAALKKMVSGARAVQAARFAYEEKKLAQKPSK